VSCCAAKPDRCSDPPTSSSSKSARPRGSSGRPQIAYTRSAADLSPPAIMHAFRRAHPGVEMHTSTAWTARNLELLTGREIDAAFIRPPTDVEDIEIMLLEEEELVLAVSEHHPPGAPQTPRWSSARSSRSAAPSCR